jgi:hypothetical protein
LKLAIEPSARRSASSNLEGLQHLAEGHVGDLLARRAVGQGAFHPRAVELAGLGVGADQHRVAQIRAGQIRAGQVRARQVGAVHAGLLEVGAHQLGVLQGRVGEVRPHRDGARQLGALQIGADQDGALRVAGALGGLQDAIALDRIGGGDGPLAQIAFEHVRPGQIRPAQTGAAQIGPPQAGLGQVGVLHIRAVQDGVIQTGPDQPAIGHDRAGEVRVAEVASRQVQPRQIGPGEHGARPARTGGEQPVVPQAHQIDLGLGEATISVLGRLGGHGFPLASLTCVFRYVKVELTPS